MCIFPNPERRNGWPDWASGSGKTTLVDVLLGLLEPQSGKLEYNGRPLQETLEEWRSHVAYLPQQVF